MNEMYLHVGFTGTRQGLTQPQKQTLTALLHRFRETYGAEYFHHGDCVGADITAHRVARDLQYKIIVHPPENPSLRAVAEKYHEIREVKPYHVRNLDIVNESDVVIACPNSSEEPQTGRPSGTWWTYLQTLKLSKTSCLILPTGEAIRR